MFREFNWVLDNGQTFKFKLDDYDHHEHVDIDYLENKKVVKI